MSNITKLNTFFCDTANTTWTIIAWESKVLNKLYQSIRDFSSYFFLQTVRWIPLMLNSSTKNYDASIIHDLLRGTKQIWRFPFKNFKSELRFKRQSQGLERHYFMIFVSLISVKRCLKWKFFFPAKKLTKTRSLRTHAPVFSLSIL